MTAERRRRRPKKNTTARTRNGVDDAHLLDEEALRDEAELERFQDDAAIPGEGEHW